MELYHILIRVQSSPASAFCRGRKQSLPVVVLKRADRDAHSFRQLSHGHKAIRQRPFIFGISITSLPLYFMTPRHKQPFFDAHAKYFPALGATPRETSRGALPAIFIEKYASAFRNQYAVAAVLAAVHRVDLIGVRVAE